MIKLKSSLLKCFCIIICFSFIILATAESIKAVEQLPANISTELTEIDITVLNYGTADIEIKESKAGALQTGREVRLSLVNRNCAYIADFAENFEWEIIGDIEIENARIEYTEKPYGSVSDLVFTIKKPSTSEASVIKLKSLRTHLQ